jgi:hypothetical protein
MPLCEELCEQVVAMLHVSICMLDDGVASMEEKLLQIDVSARADTKQRIGRCSDEAVLVGRESDQIALGLLSVPSQDCSWAKGAVDFGFPRSAVIESKSSRR